MLEDFVCVLSDLTRLGGERKSLYIIIIFWIWEYGKAVLT